MFTVARRGRDETDYRKLDDYRSNQLITATGTNRFRDDHDWNPGHRFPIELSIRILVRSNYGLILYLMILI